MLQFLSLPEDYYLPDKLHCFFPANMNKQALCFLLGQRAWLNESENPKKDCLPSVHQLPDNYSRASCKENRWRVSANNAGFLHSAKAAKQPLVCSHTETAAKWQAELPNGAGLGLRASRCLQFPLANVGLNHLEAEATQVTLKPMPPPPSPQVPQWEKHRRNASQPTWEAGLPRLMRAPTVQAFSPLWEKSGKWGELVHLPSYDIGSLRKET